ncbi:Oidioi.mRNA.OKI2018_I69.PAR.g9005.t1.cds [Oikopleura dioica]|uniref:Oidioi.mRNA.OKI2018_I69.PAR.g9005.t1.cds n=1 Tax=Oikopleura dioica TaxID=34765 RepID=A0ABN7RIM2_OIKDI|nr:Oidioi.mRNA.OKI2018_I69.PAR.g9005.t1.cds [Oikopleura dioica]
MGTLNSQALNSALVVGNFIMLKNEIEKRYYCRRTCERLDEDTCSETIRQTGRPDYYCEEYIIMLKLALSVISILLQVMYGFFEISLLVEKKQDEDAGLTEEEIEEKGKKRLKTSFTSGTVALFISVVNYFIAAFE